MNLIQEINKQMRLTQLNLPEPEELEAYLQKKFDGAVSLKWTGKRTVVVVLPRYDIPEIIDDAANRALRAFGLDYEDLAPGKPGPHGTTNKFSIYYPELNRGERHLSKREAARQRKAKFDKILDNPSWKKSLVNQPDIKNIINSLRKSNVQSN